METTDAFQGLDCRDCGSRFASEEGTHRCHDCGGILDPAYEYDAIEVTRADLEARETRSMWRYEELLPFTRGAAISMGEGGTPLVDCPDYADAVGVGDLAIKDEGRNPTGTFKDRGASVAVTAAREHGASAVALPSAGNAGQAASAYAARAGLDAHVFLPSRSGFTQKAMVNVHGGDLTVVEGRIGDAAKAYEEAMADHDWYSVATFETPYRHEGKKTMFFELAESRSWSVPDAIVYPTGGGVGLVGMYKAAREFERLGLIEEVPAFYAAQSSGCAPIVEAFESGAEGHEAWERPDTICGGIEIPDPGASPWVLEALRETGGGAVATEDDEILEAATTIAATEGLEMGATCAAAASGARELAERGELDEDDEVVLINTGAGSKDADVLRSHLMSKGV